MNKLVVTYIVTVLTLFIDTSARADDDVVVYKESCGYGGFENWNLTCKIDKNTFKSAGPYDSWADSFKDIQSITICASFSNRGNLSVPAIIVHNYKEGGQSKPTDLFDTVKFQGKLVDEKFSWVGSGPRYLPSSAWTMRGQLLRGSGHKSFIYTETLSNGRRTVGEIRATCSYLPGGPYD